MNIGSIELKPEDIIGKSWGIFGVSGSGKSNSSAVIAEELLPHVPMTFVDREGEYLGLREMFPLLIAGRDPDDEVVYDIELSVANAEYIAELSLQKSLSVILDLSNFDESEIEDILVSYFTGLWRAATKLKKLYYVVVEEAQELAPQSGKHTEVAMWLVRLAKRGRKYGVRLVVISQRPTDVSKRLLTQTEVYLLHRVTFSNDVAWYKKELDIPQAEKTTRELLTGQAFFINNGKLEIISVRSRHTTHGGSTPGIGAAPAPQYQQLDEKLLAGLRETLSVSSISDKEHRSLAIVPPDKAAQLEARMNIMGGEIKTLTKTIARLEHELAELKAMMAQPAAKPSAPAKQIASYSATNKTMALDVPPKSASPTKQPAAAAPSKPTPAPDLAALAEQRVAKRESIQVKRQLKALERTAEHIGALPNHQRVLLYALLATPSEWFTANTLSRQLGYTDGYFGKNPPKRLVDMGLLERDRSRYRIAPALHNIYPDLEQTEIKQRLRAACGVIA
jgi:uncharacterized protein